MYTNDHHVRRIPYPRTVPSYIQIQAAIIEMIDQMTISRLGDFLLLANEFAKNDGKTESKISTIPKRPENPSPTNWSKNMKTRKQS